MAALVNLSLWQKRCPLGEPLASAKEKDFPRSFDTILEVFLAIARRAT
jgi:hypothetical protein